MKFLINKKIVLLVIGCSLILATSLATPAQATILPPCAESGNCFLCDFLIGFANIATWLLSILGSVALLFFIYGGVVWLTAAGNEEKIKSGRGVLVNTVVGVVIVMASWAIINFTIISLVGAPTPTQPAKIFSTQPWYQYCESEIPTLTPTVTPITSCYQIATSLTNHTACSSDEHCSTLLYPSSATCVPTNECEDRYVADCSNGYNGTSSCYTPETCQPNGQNGCACQ